MYIQEVDFLAIFKQLTTNGHGSLAINILTSRGLRTEEYWYWVSVGVLVGYTFLFNILVILALNYLNRKLQLKSVHLLCFILSLFHIDSL
jgi:hypothetical protein